MDRGSWKQHFEEALNSVGQFSWSPQGDRIAYTGYQYENNAFIQQILIYDLAKDTQSALTDPSQIDQLYPVWSSDGNRIAFVSRDDAGIANIWIQDIQNRTLTQVTQNTDPEAWLYSASFSPDNRYLAYMVNMSLYLVELASGVTSCAETGTMDVSQYKWSLSEDKIAYQTLDPGFNVSVYDVSSRTSRQVTNAYNINLFEWSADGMQIIYATSGTWVYNGSGNEYQKPEIRIAPANVPDCDRTLLQLDSEPQYLFISSNAIWYGESQNSNFNLYQWSPGRFTFSNVALQPGENEFYALSINNNTGAVSPGSDPILINVDQGTTPDLEVLSTGIYCYPAAPLSGDKVTGTITVQNIGAAAAENVDVAVYLTDPLGFQQLISTATIPRIEPSGTDNCSFDWDTTGKTGVYRISAIADPNNQILELSESQ